MSNTVHTDVVRDGDEWTITATLPTGERWSKRIRTSKGTAHMIARELAASAALFLDRAEMVEILERIYQTHGPMVFTHNFPVGRGQPVLFAYEVHPDDLCPTEGEPHAPIACAGGRKGRLLELCNAQTWSEAARKLETYFNDRATRKEPRDEAP